MLASSRLRHGLRVQLVPEVAVRLKTRYGDYGPGQNPPGLTTAQLLLLLLLFLLLVELLLLQLVLTLLFGLVCRLLLTRFHVGLVLRCSGLLPLEAFLLLGAFLSLL